MLPPVTDLFEALEPGRAPAHRPRATPCRSPKCAWATPRRRSRAPPSSPAGATPPSASSTPSWSPRRPWPLPWSKDGEPGVKIYDGGQGGYEDRRQIAELLDLPERLVNVVLVQNGGAFGGKEDLMGQHHAALLCLATGRPVMLRFDRKMSLRMHAKRHPIVMDYAAGLRPGRPAGGPGGAHAFGLRRLRQRRHEGDRAGRGPLGRRLRHPQRPREGHRGDHQQRLLRRHARLRRQPGLLRHRVQRGRAVRHGRLRPLAVPLGQRPGGRQGHRHRPGAHQRGGRARLPGGPEGPVPGRQLRGHRRRHQEHRHRLRHAGLRPGQDRRAGPGQGGAPPRLVRDGPGGPQHGPADPGHRDRHRSGHHRGAGGDRRGGLGRA